MAKQEKPQASIIEVIQEMVRNGESEENIIKSLEQLGIEPDKAKRLLLVGQADTFALLQSEITKIVRNQVEMEKPQLVEYIQYATGKAEDKMTEKVEKRALSAFREDQRFIENQATLFQARVNQSVKNILQLNTETKKNIAELGNRLANNERDVWALKYKVFGNKLIQSISIALIVLQTGLVFASAYLLFTAFPGANTNQMVLAVIIGAIMATIVYLIGLRR